MAGSRRTPQRHPWRIVHHMLRSGLALFPVVGITLLAGMVIYHYVEHLSWSSSYVNAAMLLGGMGPVDPLKTEAGKWLAGSYALVAGLLVLVVAGVMLAPMIHHVLQHYGFSEDSSESKR
jgi:hypothetical protein